MSLTLSLRVEISVGTSPADACREMIDLARQLDIHVVADFNGVDIHAYPHDDHLRLVAALGNARKRGEEHAFGPIPGLVITINPMPGCSCPKHPFVPNKGCPVHRELAP